MPPPLATSAKPPDDHSYHFLQVEGEGLYEIPVGPIHAGIIEPGHFRFSCFGEVIVNLEIRLGYVHRGIEKQLASVAWQDSRFIVEAAASDMAVANALANASALESLLDVEVPERAAQLRTAALEVERVAMHLSDLSGLAGDIGFLAISSSLGRMRGSALRLADLLSGNRFMRSYVRPGGVGRDLTLTAATEMLCIIGEIEKESRQVLEMYLDNQVAIDRMDGVGVVSHSLAEEFGLVGVAARASGHDYDCRKYWSHGIYPEDNFATKVEHTGDVLARARIRIHELFASLTLLKALLANLSSGNCCVEVGENLPSNSTSIGIVESHRGELLHLIITDETGNVRRYCIKDPSVNNWTGLAIAVRNNLVADFPLCNKSFSLSYSGHDL
jgi:Ni,Fe-hydrogenase III large subunit